MNSKNEDPSQNNKPSLMEVIGSAFSAVLGVQSSKNRERDFKHGKASTFIITGVIFTIALVLTLVGIVRLVLRQAGL